MAVQNKISSGALQPNPNASGSGIRDYISPGAIQPGAYVAAAVVTWIPVQQVVFPSRQIEMIARKGP